MQPLIKTYTSYMDLPKLVIPPFQRSLNKADSRKMALHIKEQRDNNSYPFFGCIDVVIYDGVNYIIDGQHRVDALKRDYEKYKKETFFTVMYHTVKRYKKMVRIFEIRNLGVPIPNYIFSCSTDEERSILVSIHRYYLDKDGFCSDSTKRPLINITIFMDKIVEEDIISRENITSLEDFKEFLKSKNKLIKKLCQDENFCKRKGITDSMLNKCEINSLYIGVLKNMEWLNFEE